MCQAKELKLYSGDSEESLAGFNWGITCSDLSAEKASLVQCRGWSEEDTLWRQRNDKNLNRGSVCRCGMLGMDSRAIKEVKLAGHGN